MGQIKGKIGGNKRMKEKKNRQKFEHNLPTVEAYIFDSDGENECVDGLEQPNGFLVWHSNQTVPIDIN